MKIFKSLLVSIDFLTKFLIISLATPTNAYFQNFLNFSVNFRENFDDILKNFQKIAKFPLQFSKNYKIFIDFKIFFETFRV